MARLQTIDVCIRQTRIKAKRDFDNPINWPDKINEAVRRRFEDAGQLSAKGFFNDVPAAVYEFLEEQPFISYFDRDEKLTSYKHILSCHNRQTREVAWAIRDIDDSAAVAFLSSVRINGDVYRSFDQLHTIEAGFGFKIFGTNSLKLLKKGNFNFDERLLRQYFEAEYIEQISDQADEDMITPFPYKLANVDTSVLLIFGHLKLSDYHQNNLIEVCERFPTFDVDISLPHEPIKIDLAVNESSLSIEGWAEIDPHKINVNAIRKFGGE